MAFSDHAEKFPSRDHCGTTVGESQIRTGAGPGQAHISTTSELEMDQSWTETGPLLVTVTWSEVGVKPRACWPKGLELNPGDLVQVLFQDVHLVVQKLPNGTDGSCPAGSPASEGSCCPMWLHKVTTPKHQSHQPAPPVEMQKNLKIKVLLHISERVHVNTSIHKEKNLEEFTGYCPAHTKQTGNKRIHIVSFA